VPKRKPPGAERLGCRAASGAKPNEGRVKRFNLSGYVINTDYSLGPNAGNTFQQTHEAASVIGVPNAGPYVGTKGPYVGTKFPREDYVAMPIGNHELYVAWQDTKTHALLDVFVMDFATGVVFDYVPGSPHPENSGTVTVVHKGSHPLP
jgi:hypothetical protein